MLIGIPNMLAAFATFALMGLLQGLTRKRETNKHYFHHSFTCYCLLAISEHIIMAFRVQHVKIFKGRNILDRKSRKYFRHTLRIYLMLCLEWFDNYSSSVYEQEISSRKHLTDAANTGFLTSGLLINLCTSMLGLHLTLQFPLELLSKGKIKLISGMVAVRDPIGTQQNRVCLSGLLF